MENSKKQPLFRKIVLSILVLSMVISSSFFIPPQKAEAQGGIGATVPVADWLNYSNHTVTSKSTLTIATIEDVLNPLFMMIAKTVLRKMTASIINWINTGFQGQPFFLTNPAAFFNNIAKEQTNVFVIDLIAQKTNNPYAVDIAYSILNPSGNGFTLYDDMARNCQLRGGGNSCPPDLSNPYAREAYARQFVYGNIWGPGGWSNWYSLTQYDKNNIYGAYLQAQRDLARRKAEAAGYAQQDLLQSGGFLSFRKCVHKVSAPVEDESGGHMAETCDRWETQTPGKAAADYLTASLTSPIRQGELAKTFMDSVGAIVEALVNQVTMMGVRSLSDAAAGVVSSGANQPTFNFGSYTSQLSYQTNPAYVDQSSNIPQTSGVGSVDEAINNEVSYRSAKTSVFGILRSAETSIGILSACYYRIIDLDQKQKTQEPVVSGLKFASTTLDTINAQKISIGTATTSSAQISVKLNDFKNRLTSATNNTPAFSNIFQEFILFRGSAHGATDISLINMTEAAQAQSLLNNEIIPRITACEKKETEIQQLQGVFTPPSAG